MKFLIFPIIALCLQGPALFASSSGSSGSKPATCKPLFSTPNFKSSTANRLLRAEKMADLITHGIPSELPFLRISKGEQLRFYRTELEQVLYFEKLVPLGRFTKHEAKKLEDRYFPETLVIREISRHHVQVSFWKISKDIPIDPLTGLIGKNGEATKKVIERFIETYSEKKDSALLFLDIDSLNLINYLPRGHSRGDVYIQRIIEIVKENLRIDRGSAESRDVGFRNGGDEFFFLLQGIRERDFSLVRDRIDQNIRNDTRIKELIHTALKDYNDFLNYLSGIRTYQDMASNKDVLFYIEKSHAWQKLNVFKKRRIRNNPESFQRFITRYVNSKEASLKTEQISSILLGASMSIVKIEKNQGFDQLMEKADHLMQTEKGRRKEERRSNLPRNLRDINKEMLSFPQI